MIYEQLLLSKGTTGAKIKRTFQVIGFLHILLGTVIFVIALFIYWKLALYLLTIFAVGLIWGNIAYIFTSDYKYTYNNGVFAVYKRNAYNKFVLVLEVEAEKMKECQSKKVKKLTNRSDFQCFCIDGQCVAITIDDYMESLIKRSEE